MILLPKLLQQVLLNLTLPVGCVWAWWGWGLAGGWIGCVPSGIPDLHGQEQAGGRAGGMVVGGP